MEAHTTHEPDPRAFERAASTETAPSRRRWPEQQEPSGGRVLLIVGVILAVIGIWLLFSGGRAFLAFQGRDAEGYYNSGTEGLATDLYALSSPPEFSGAGPDVLYARDLLGDVRISGTNTRPDTPLFIGIGPADEVAAYLDGVGHDEIRDIEVSPFAAEYETHEGGAPAELPTEQTIWATSVSGTGTQTLEMKIPAGDWSVVVMNADGSAGVSADLRVGATLPIIGVILLVALAIGALVLVIGIVLTLLGLRKRV
jgi:hypothetical protein